MFVPLVRQSLPESGCPARKTRSLVRARTRIIPLIVPDTASAGTNGVTWLDGCAPGYPHNRCSYVLTIPDLILNARATASPWRVDLVWVAGDSSADSVTVYRRTSGVVPYLKGLPHQAGSWDRVADVHAGAGGELRYTDQAVLPGSTYHYRLGLPVEQRQIYRGEITVNVPPVTEFRILPVAPNPSRKAPAITVIVPSADPARLDVLDVGGRTPP